MEAIPALQFTRGYWSDNQAFGGSKNLFQQKEAGPSFWQMHSKNKKKSTGSLKKKENQSTKQASNEVRSSILNM